MYKVLFVLENEFGALEELLNEWAEEGYKAIFFMPSHGRLLAVMEKQPQRGRPVSKKDIEESKLGV